MNDSGVLNNHFQQNCIPTGVSNDVLISTNENSFYNEADCICMFKIVFHIFPEIWVT